MGWNDQQDAAAGPDYGALQNAGNSHVLGAMNKTVRPSNQFDEAIARIEAATAHFNQMAMRLENVMDRLFGYCPQPPSSTKENTAMDRPEGYTNRIHSYLTDLESAEERVRVQLDRATTLA